MKIHRMTHLALFLLSIVGGFYSCNSEDKDTLLTKVVDLKGDLTQTWQLEYDADNRLVSYGDTPLEYGSSKIVIGELEWKYRGECMHDVTFYLKDGQVRNSEAHCWLDTEGGKVKALKKTYYQPTQDTLFVSSYYYVENDFCPASRVEIKYVYDDRDRLTEILSVHYNEEGEESGACHCYYGYDANIRYVSNLNLLAYIVDREGLDTFFYLLLNLGNRKTDGALPDQIRHCVNRGSATYTADGLYRLTGYTPTKMEVVSLNAELKARLELEHGVPD